MARRKNVDWSIPDLGQTVTVDEAQLAVLMDIRDELQRLNALLHCQNFQAIPSHLRSIARNTTKARKKRAN
jgi:ABC-type transporter Mla MlaB component